MKVPNYPQWVEVWKGADSWYTRLDGYIYYFIVTFDDRNHCATAALHRRLPSVSKWHFMTSHRFPAQEKQEAVERMKERLEAYLVELVL